MRSQYRLCIRCRRRFRNLLRARCRGLPGSEGRLAGTGTLLGRVGFSLPPAPPTWNLGLQVRRSMQGGCLEGGSSSFLPFFPAAAGGEGRQPSGKNQVILLKGGVEGRLLVRGVSLLPRFGRAPAQPETEAGHHGIGNSVDKHSR